MNIECRGLPYSEVTQDFPRDLLATNFTDNVFSRNIRAKEKFYFLQLEVSENQVFLSLRTVLDTIKSVCSLLLYISVHSTIFCSAYNRQNLSPWLLHHCWQPHPTVFQQEITEDSVLLLRPLVSPFTNVASIKIVLRGFAPSVTTTLDFEAPAGSPYQKIILLASSSL